jgi:hypothetical protein
MTTATSSQFLEAFNAQLGALCGDETDHKFSGRGIVIAAGGVSMFTNAYVLIHVLRKQLHCTLPIEVWHFGGTELSPRMQGLLSELDVAMVDADGLAKIKAAPIRDGWQLKSFAVLWSRFAEILLLDADQTPAIDPAVVFEWPEYQKSGAVFWPDVVELRESNEIWDLVGLPRSKLRSIESGQLLVDKRRHWKALCATYLLNAEAETVYQLIYGDKDTFLIGWLMTQSPFSLVPHLPFVDEYCLAQRDFSGEIFLQHRTNGKWSYAGEQLRPQRVLHEEASHSALEELRRKWNGRIFLPPDRSFAARGMEKKLVAIGSLRFEIEGEPPTTLEFWADGEFGLGRNHDAQNWAVVDDASVPGGLKLIIMHSTINTFSLTVDELGNWSGQRLRKPVVQVTAIPLNDSQQIKTESMEATLVDSFLNAANFFNRTAEADSDLNAAFRLLSQLELSVEKRLRILSQQQPKGSDHRARLEALADHAKAAQTKGLSPTKKDLSLLGRGYTR